MLLFVSGSFWLILGTVLTLIASIKLHGPGFLADTPWLTLGRVRPAAMNTLLYGFACQTALGILLWLMCRLGRVLLFNAPVIVVGAILWNLGVTAGVVGILAGASTGFPWLEMPRFVAPILFIAYALIGLCAILTFHLRRERELYVSQWYLLAALFWFPWIYSAATLLLLFDPVRGTLQSAVNAWYTNNLLGLWLTPVGLGAAYYFIPKLSNRPLFSREIAIFGFWTLAFFTNWSGLTQLTGGPIPLWMISASFAATVLLLVPLCCVATNFHLTLRGQYREVKENLILRFVVFGAICYLMASLQGIVGGIPQVSEITHFTYFVVAQTHLALFGFFGMVMFGALYYIIPRLTQVDWPRSKLVRVHFLFSAGGITLDVVVLIIGGLIQGSKMNDPGVGFVDLVKSTIPLVGLSTLGLLSMLIGQIAFLGNLYLLLRKFCAVHCKAVLTRPETAKTEANL